MAACCVSTARRRLRRGNPAAPGRDDPDRRTRQTRSWRKPALVSHHAVSATRFPHPGPKVPPRLDSIVDARIDYAEVGLALPRWTTTLGIRAATTSSIGRRGVGGLRGPYPNRTMAWG